MRTANLLEQLLDLAKQLGYTVRMEDLGGEGGGICEFGGKKWLFVDLTATSADQLQRTCDCLRLDPHLSRVALSPQMDEVLAGRRAA
jgi:hypothetical protein